MKPWRAIFVGCLIACFAPLGSQTLGAYMEIRIEAGANPSPAAGWNVISGGTANMGVAISLTDATGEAIGVTATLASILRWSNTGDDKLGDAGYNGTALADGTDYALYIHHPSASVPWRGTLTLDGLESEGLQWYRIEMSASAAPSQWPKTQDAQVNGEWANGDHIGRRKI